MTAAVLLASIVTRSLGAFLTVPGWQTNSIPSESICYGTDGSSFYLRPTAESAAAVSSLMDAVYERDIVGCRFATDVTDGDLPFYAVPVTNWPTCSARPLGIRPSWDTGAPRVISPTFRLLSAADIHNSCTNLAPGGVIDDMGWANSDSPPLPHGSETFPIWNGITAANWLTAFPTFSALTNDAVYRGVLMHPERKTLSDLASFFRGRSVAARNGLSALLEDMSSVPLTNSIADVMNHADLLPHLTNMTMRLDAKKIGAANNLAAAAEVSYAVTNLPPMANLIYEELVKDCGTATEYGETDAVIHLRSNRWEFAVTPHLEWDENVGGVSATVSNLNALAQPTFRVKVNPVGISTKRIIEVERFLPVDEFGAIINSAMWALGASEGDTVNVSWGYTLDGSSAVYRTTHAWTDEEIIEWDYGRSETAVTDMDVTITNLFPRSFPLARTVQSVHTDYPSHTNLDRSAASSAVPMPSLWGCVRQERLYPYTMFAAALDCNLGGPLNIDTIESNRVIRFEGDARTVTDGQVDQTLVGFAIADDATGRSIISQLAGRAPVATNWVQITAAESESLRSSPAATTGTISHDLLAEFILRGVVGEGRSITSWEVVDIPVQSRGLPIGVTQMVYEFIPDASRDMDPADLAAQFDCFEALATRTRWRFRNLSPAD